MNNIVYVGTNLDYGADSGANPGGHWNRESAHIGAFRELNLNQKLLENIYKSLPKIGQNRLAQPLPIQQYALKPALQSEDIYCISSTGM